MTPGRTWVLAFALILAYPAQAAAQACLANGAAPGQGHASAAASFTDGAWALGGTLGSNLEGAPALQANVTHTFVDNTDATTTAVGGTAAADVAPSATASVCPVASVSYQWLSDDAGTDLDADGVALGGGLAIGAELGSDNSAISFIPQATGAVVHDRATVSAGGVSETDSETYGSFSGALMVAGESVYAGPSASITTLEGSDPVFSITLGFAF